MLRNAKNRDLSIVAISLQRQWRAPSRISPRTTHAGDYLPISFSAVVHIDLIFGIVLSTAAERNIEYRKTPGGLVLRQSQRYRRKNSYAPE